MPGWNPALDRADSRADHLLATPRLAVAALLTRVLEESFGIVRPQTGEETAIAGHASQHRYFGEKRPAMAVGCTAIAGNRSLPKKPMRREETLASSGRDHASRC